MQSSSALFGTFSPLTPAYWADARAQLKNVRMLTLAGIITAASIVLESFPIYLLGTSLKIYFSFLVISLGCYVYGPAVGILVGFANDTLGFLISSFGEPYFPGYLITAMLSGLIYGTLLYRQRITVLRLVVVRLIINYGSNVLLGSVWKAMLYGKGYYYYFTTGLIKNTTMLPIEVLLMVLMFQLALPALARSGLLPKEVAVQKRLAWFKTARHLNG